jgi:hypothetical protein
VDRALQFHQVDCRLWQFEAAATDELPVPAAPVQRPPVRKIAAWRKAAAVLGDAFRPAGLAAG